MEEHADYSENESSEYETEEASSDEESEQSSWNSDHNDGEWAQLEDEASDNELGNDEENQSRNKIR